MAFTRYSRSFLKTIAFATFLFFTVSSIAQAAPLSQVAFVNTEVAASASFPIPPFISLAPIHLSQEQGKLEELFTPSEGTEKKPFVYLIQDAHDSIDAQENIRRVLAELIEKEKISAVYFEGGSVELDRSFYDFAHDAKLNIRIWDRLLEGGEIGGLERYALEAPGTTHFFGIENEAVYFQNIHSIQKVYAGEEKTAEALREIETVFEQLNGRLLTGDIKKIRDERKSFYEKKITLLQYSKDLAKWAEKIQKLDLSSPASQGEWPQFVRLMKLGEFEQKLQQNEKEVQKSLASIPQSAIRNPQLNFVWDPSQHGRVKGHLRWYFEKLVDQGLELEKDPYLKDWVGFHILQDEMDPSDLFKELGRLETQLLNDPQWSEDVRKFLQMDRNYEIIRRLLTLNLTRDEWNEVKEKNLDLKRLSKEFVDLYTKTFHQSPQINSSKLISLFNAAKANYEIVEKRDQILSSKILERLESEKPEKAALVIGGFHTDRMASFLKEKNIGYAVISPAIHDINHKLNYRARINAVPASAEVSSSADQTPPAVEGGLSIFLSDHDHRLSHLYRVAPEIIKAVSVHMTRKANQPAMSAKSLGGEAKRELYEKYEININEIARDLTDDLVTEIKSPISETNRLSLRPTDSSVKNWEAKNFYELMLRIRAAQNDSIKIGNEAYGVYNQLLRQFQIMAERFHRTEAQDTARFFNMFYRGLEKYRFTQPQDETQAHKAVQNLIKLDVYMGLLYDVIDHNEPREGFTYPDLYSPDLIQLSMKSNPEIENFWVYFREGHEAYERFSWLLKHFVSAMSYEGFNGNIGEARLEVLTEQVKKALSLFASEHHLSQPDLKIELEPGLSRVLNHFVSEDYQERGSASIRSPSAGLGYVLFEVIKNGLQVGAGSEVTLQVRNVPDRKQIEILVRDNGGGMSISTLAQIFRYRHSTKSESGGVGLFISANIVRFLGGTIEVVSKPNGGTMAHELSFESWEPRTTINSYREDFPEPGTLVKITLPAVPEAASLGLAKSFGETRAITINRRKSQRERELPNKMAKLGGDLKQALEELRVWSQEEKIHFSSKEKVHRDLKKMIHELEGYHPLAVLTRKVHSGDRIVIFNVGGQWIKTANDVWLSPNLVDEIATVRHKLILYWLQKIGLPQKKSDDEQSNCEIIHQDYKKDEIVIHHSSSSENFEWNHSLDDVTRKVIEGIATYLKGYTPVGYDKEPSPELKRAWDLTVIQNLKGKISDTSYQALETFNSRVMKQPSPQKAVASPGSLEESSRKTELDYWTIGDFINGRAGIVGPQIGNFPNTKENPDQETIKNAYNNFGRMNMHYGVSDPAAFVKDMDSDEVRIKKIIAAEAKATVASRMSDMSTEKDLGVVFDRNHYLEMIRGNYVVLNLAEENGEIVVGETRYRVQRDGQESATGLVDPQGTVYSSLEMNGKRTIRLPLGEFVFIVDQKTETVRLETNDIYPDLDEVNINGTQFKIERDEYGSIEAFVSKRNAEIYPVRQLAGNKNYLRIGEMVYDLEIDSASKNIVRLVNPGVETLIEDIHQADPELTDQAGDYRVLHFVFSKFVRKDKGWKGYLEKHFPIKDPTFDLAALIEPFNTFDDFIDSEKFKELPQNKREALDRMYAIYAKARRYLSFVSLIDYIKPWEMDRDGEKNIAIKKSLKVNKLLNQLKKLEIEYLSIMNGQAHVRIQEFLLRVVRTFEPALEALFQDPKNHKVTSLLAFHTEGGATQRTAYIMLDKKGFGERNTRNFELMTRELLKKGEEAPRVLEDVLLEADDKVTQHLRADEDALLRIIEDEITKTNVKIKNAVTDYVCPLLLIGGDETYAVVPEAILTDEFLGRLEKLGTSIGLTTRVIATRKEHYEEGRILEIDRHAAAKVDLDTGVEKTKKLEELHIHGPVSLETVGAKPEWLVKIYNERSQTYESYPVSSIMEHVKKPLLEGLSNSQKIDELREKGVKDVDAILRSRSATDKFLSVLFLIFGVKLILKLIAAIRARWESGEEKESVEQSLDYEVEEGKPVEKPLSTLDTSKIKKVLIISYDRRYERIADQSMDLKIAELLKNKLDPESQKSVEIHFLVAYPELLEGNPNVSEVILADKEQGYASKERLSRFTNGRLRDLINERSRDPKKGRGTLDYRKLRRFIVSKDYDYDLVIDLDQVSPKQLLPSRGARKEVTLITRSAGRAPFMLSVYDSVQKKLVTHDVPLGKVRINENEYLQRIAEYRILGLEANDNDHPTLYVSEIEKRQAREGVLKEMGIKFNDRGEAVMEVVKDGKSAYERVPIIFINPRTRDQEEGRWYDRYWGQFISKLKEKRFDPQEAYWIVETGYEDNHKSRALFVAKEMLKKSIYGSQRAPYEILLDRNSDEHVREILAVLAQADLVISQDTRTGDLAFHLKGPQVINLMYDDPKILRWKFPQGEFGETIVVGNGHNGKNVNGKIAEILADKVLEKLPREAQSLGVKEVTRPWNFHPSSELFKQKYYRYYFAASLVSLLALIGSYAFFLATLFGPSISILPLGLTHYAGIALAMMGFGMAAYIYVKKQFIDKDFGNRLLRDGVYAYHHHPIFAFQMMGVLGIFLFYPSLATFLTAAFWYAHTKIESVREEVDLWHKFGDKFVKYREGKSIQPPKQIPVEQPVVSQSEGSSLGTLTPELVPLANSLGQTSRKRFQINSDEEFQEQYGNSWQAVLVVVDASGKLISLDVKKIFRNRFDVLMALQQTAKSPELDKLWKYLSSQPEYQGFISKIQREEPSLVITGPVSPRALILQIKEHKTIITYYEDPKFKEQFNAQAEEMMAKGLVLESELKKYGYFVYLPKLGMTHQELIEHLLKNKKVNFDDMGPRSLGRIATEAGVRNFLSHVVWLGDKQLISDVLAKLPVALGLPLRAFDETESFSENKTPREILVLKLASLLSQDVETLKQQGMVRVEGNEYVPTDLFNTFVAKILEDKQAMEIVASKA